METNTTAKTPGNIHPDSEPESPLQQTDTAPGRSRAGFLLLGLLGIFAVLTIGYYLLTGFGSQALDRVAKKDIGYIARGEFDPLYKQLNLASEDQAATTRVLKAATSEGSCHFSAGEHSRTAGGMIAGNSASISGTLACGKQSFFLVLYYAGKGTPSQPYKLYQVVAADIQNGERSIGTARLLDVYTEYKLASTPDARPLRYPSTSIAEADKALADGRLGDSCAQTAPTKVALTLLSSAHFESWRTVSCTTIKKPSGAV